MASADPKDGEKNKGKFFVQFVYLIFKRHKSSKFNIVIVKLCHNNILGP